MKKSLLVIFFFISVLTGYSQQQLLVQRNDKGLYLNHTVAARENFYSIGRLYNLSPKDIAAFNALDMANGLSVGQTVMIPLNEHNFTQSGSQGVPVYYVVGEKEGLYRVSVNNAKVEMASIRKWNNLTNDNISAGQQLIVGYLQSAELQQQKSTASANDTAAAPADRAPATQTATAPPQRQPEPARSGPENRTATQQGGGRQQVATGGTGYFKGQFDLQNISNTAGKDLTVTSGIFKTASGWQDAKYYALIDRVEPGTIVQVVNPSNNKAIYAKVLGEMSGIRQNQGLELRISNAAASALEINDTEKFIVRVAY